MQRSGARRDSTRRDAMTSRPEERERDFLFNRGGGWERDNTCRAERGRTANGTPHVGGEELFRSVRVNGEEYAFGSCVSVLFELVDLLTFAFFVGNNVV